MKKIAIIFLLALTVIAVNAKGTDEKSSDTESNSTALITGTVADLKSGEALVGVEVKIEGTDLKTYTDFDGNFAFKNVKPGDYKLVANYISYQKKTEELHLSAKENELTIKLQSSN